MNKVEKERLETPRELLIFTLVVFLGTFICGLGFTIALVCLNLAVRLWFVYTSFWIAWLITAVFLIVIYILHVAEKNFRLVFFGSTV